MIALQKNLGKTADRIRVIYNIKQGRINLLKATLVSKFTIKSNQCPHC